MPRTQIETDIISVLSFLSTVTTGDFIEATDLAKQTDLPPDRINDAVAVLVESGHLEWMQTMGTTPFHFRRVTITSRGRYEFQRMEADFQQQAGLVETTDSLAMIPPPAPIGSPYGFTDVDWETVALRKHVSNILHVVFGHQFKSDFYYTEHLRKNIESTFIRSVERYNEEEAIEEIVLDFKSLSAGYGEHLFNDIARDIIGADIAVFETSDMNPNVMLEMGVALTWGTRVLPIKQEGRPKPPSDVSGQTWADYNDSGAAFLDPEHDDKLLQMIKRAMRKKR